MSSNILSIDGGGMRGIIPATWLDHLERRLQQPLGSCFHLLAGTSTGSLLACGIAAGFPVKDIVEVYLTQGPEIFPPRSRLSKLRAWRRPMYRSDGIRKVLESKFGSMLFNDLPKRTLVTSYETETGTAILFDSQRHYGWVSQIQAEMTVVDVCLASCSAPIVFPAHKVPSNGGHLSLVDGGVMANNPALLALGRLGDTPSRGSALLVSLGTGEIVEQLGAQEAQRMGMLAWSPRIVPFIFDGNSDGVHQAAYDLLGQNYYRFQIKLFSGAAGLDNTDPENLADLQRAARLHLQEGSVGALAMSHLLRRLA